MLRNNKGDVGIIVILTYIAIAFAFAILVYSYTQSFVSSDYYNAKRDSAVLGLSMNSLPKLQGEFKAEFDRDLESKYVSNSKEVIVEKGDIKVKYTYTYDGYSRPEPVKEEGGKIVLSYG